MEVLASWIPLSKQRWHDVSSQNQSIASLANASPGQDTVMLFSITQLIDNGSRACLSCVWERHCFNKLPSFFLFVFAFRLKTSIWRSVILEISSRFIVCITITKQFIALYPWWANWNHMGERKTENKKNPPWIHLISLFWYFIASTKIDWLFWYWPVTKIASSCLSHTHTCVSHTHQLQVIGFLWVHGWEADSEWKKLNELNCGHIYQL